MPSEHRVVLDGAQKRIQFFDVAWGFSLFNGLYLHGIRGGPFFRELHSIIKTLTLIEFAFIFVEGDFFLSSSLKQLLLILIMSLLVPAEYKDIVTDVYASHYGSSDFFADGFLGYLPSGSCTKIESLVLVETYMCRKSGDVADVLLQFQLVVPMVHIKMRKYCGPIELIYIVKCRHDSAGSWSGFICFPHIHIQPYFIAGPLRRYNYRGHPTGRRLCPLNYVVSLQFLQFCFQLESYTQQYSPVGLCNRCYCGVNLKIYLHSFHLSDTPEQISVLF